MAGPSELTLRHVIVAFLFAAALVTGCAPEIKVVEVLVTSEPQVNVVQVTATPTLAPTVTPTPQIDVEPVSLTTEDGVEISGYLFGDGDTAVVLAHMGIADQSSWESFARFIAGRGYTALTFDFRGYGQSGFGGEGYGATARELGYYQDVLAAIGFLRDRGFDRVACIGASMGGTACMNAALKTELVGLVVIASPAPRRVLEQAYPEDLVNATMPKLFVVAENDRYIEVVWAAAELYEISPEPKQIRVFPGTVHGTELFDTESGDAFRDLLVGFLQGIQ